MRLIVFKREQHLPLRLHRELQQIPGPLKKENFLEEKDFYNNLVNLESLFHHLFALKSKGLFNLLESNFPIFHDADSARDSFVT